MALEIRKNSYTTIYFQINQKETPTSTLSAYDLSSTTATFAAATDTASVPVIVKSSTAASEMVYTSATGGELEVYIRASDTEDLPAQKYNFTLYSVNAAGKKFNLAFDKFTLRDNIDY